MKQRFLSIFLALALIIPFFPQVTLPAKAAETTAKTQDENSNENTDAFGIKMDTTIDTKKEKANNPYGTEGWVNLFTVPELFVSQGYDGYRSFETYNYNNDRDHKEGSIGSITDGTRTGKKEEGNKNGFTIMDTAPVDAEGEGQKRYVAVLGYWLGGKRLELYIADKDGNRVSDTYAIGGEKTLDYLEQADAFEDTGFVSVAAGDFNGDGKDTVIAYAPLMESDSEQPQLWEFSITAYGNNMQLDKTGTVCNIFDILGTENIATKHSNNGKVFRNTPVVQMTTADTDKDSVDELVVTAGMNNTKADVNNRQSRMFIYDNITEEEKSYWNKTFELDTKGYNNGNQRLRWASSSVGNLVMTGSGADYPEIITAGWVDKKTNKDADLTHDIGAYVTSCSKTTKKGNSAIGTYAKSEVPAIGSNGQPQVSGFTKDGHYRDDVQSLVVVDTFAADGVNAAASVLIMDTIYTYEAGKGLNQEFRTDYFNHSDNGIGTSIITNGLVQDAVSGNFSGNEEGREQIVFTTCQKRASKNQYFYKTYTYKKTGKSSWQYNSTGYRISKKGNAYTSLCAPDIDSDSTIARIKDVSLTYTEPEVLALLESTPYFSEVDEGDIGNSETAYGKENGEGTSVSTAEGLTTNIVAGFEWSVDDICAGFVCGAGFETSVEQGYTWETATSTTKKFSLNYSNDTGENQVIVYRRPVTTYRYEIKGTKDTMVLARQGTLLTSMLPVDEYNEAAQSYELEEIADGTLATPGNPFSYRSSTAGLNNVAESKITTQYGKEGTVTQEFSTETEQEKTFTYDLNASFTAYGLVFGVKAGGGAGTTYSESQSTINTEAITKTGAVTGKQVEGYDFNWKFAHWTTKVNGTEIPVLGYVLTNVIAPPSPPENLAVESVTSDSAKITWDAGERGADEYRIYQIYSDGSDIQIGTVDGTESTYEVTGLKPDTSYTYAIKAYKEGKKGDAISGESVFSEKLIVTTLPEKMGTVTITNPENASVKIGGSAVFKADLSSTASDYRATNYKWQRREKGGKWQTIDGAKSSKLTLNDLTEEDNDTEYRCIFRVSYTSASSLIEYYSKAATLTVGETAVAPKLTITGHDNTGDGTLAIPYAGKSDYNKKTGTTTQKIETTQNITIEKSGTHPELTVYTDGDKTAPKYYGIGKDDKENIVYYQVVKNGDAYTAGDKITFAEKYSYTNLNGDAVTDVPTEFNSGKDSVTVTKDNVTYYLQAKITGKQRAGISTGSSGVKSKDSRLESMTGITYYWKSNNGYYTYDPSASDTPGSAVTLSDADKNALYDVYHKANTKVVVGRNETYTVSDTSTVNGKQETTYENESQYGFALVTISSGETTTYTITSIQEDVKETYTVGDTELAGFDPAKLTLVTKQVINIVETPVYTTQAGDRLTLRAKVTENDNSKAAAGASVEFKIVNTQTNGVETISATTDANGAAKTKWTAATSGLYSIQVNVLAKSGYTASATKAQYYNAGGTYETNTTEYRLVLSSAGKTLTGTMTYGGIVSYELQERAITVSSDAAKAQTVGEWKKSEKTNLTYTVETTEKDRKKVDEVKQPLSVASYNFRVYDGDTIDPQKELAAAALQVTKAAVTITPEIKNGVTPSSASDIILKVEPEISGVNLNDVLNVNCGYFTDKTATGKFDVILSYKTDSNGAVTDKVKAFQNNYTAALESASFTVKPDSAQVKFSCGENGTIVGHYADNWYPMASGSNQTKGTRLRFVVAPNSGYGVAKWIINGTDYEVDAKNLPEGMRISEDGKRLDVASFNPASQTASTNPGHTKDGVLTVEVSFKSTSHKITYNVDGKGGTLTAVNENDKKINSGTKITQGSKVTFTAEPEDGYIVSGWKVDGNPYKWQDKDKDYLGTTLVLEDISKDEDVIVSFEKSTASYKVITSVADEEGKTDTSLAKVTAINAETKEAVTNLTSIKKGTTLTFTASVADKTNHMVKLWQTSKDGKTWEDAALSGGSNTFTLYNISENLYIRPVITVAQKYSLKYKVVLDDGKPGETIVTDKKIAELTATSNGQEIASGESHSAYIPVEFALSLNNDYYVTGWSKNVKAGEDLSAASLDALDSNTEVVVTIKEKPVVTIPSAANGSIKVTFLDADEKEVIVNDKDHVEAGTNLIVTLIPEKGYVVDDDVLGTSVKTEYTDEDKSGKTTDTKSYKVENVIADVTVAGAFKALETHKVTYEPVIAAGESANGTLTAKADRKQMDIYKIDELTTDEKVYEGSTLTFTAAPDTDYSIQEWRINGTILKEDGIKVTDSVLTLPNIAKDYTVTVQFKKSGSDTTIAAGENGKIVSAVAGKVDQIANIESGFVLAAGATVDITAQPDTGYKVGCWKVNGKVVDGQTGNTYTYTADENGTGAAITVQFVQIDYAVSWSAVNGTVKAEDTSGTEYEGNKADIRGGSQVTFSATPKEAYKVSCWKVNGKAVDGENANTFTFTVPSGAKETPTVASYKVEAVCEKDQFTLTYAQPSNGTLTAKGAAGEVASGDKVNGDEKYTFTVKPDADYIVESWTVDGQVIDSHSASYEVTVKKDTEVSVQLVPASYKVTYKVNNEQGKLLVGKDTEEKTDGEIAAAYGTSIKFTAVSNKFCHIKGWKLDGTEVTDTTEGISISADGSELTLSEVKKEHSVEAIFDAATMYEVSYEVDEKGAASDAGTLKAKAGNTYLKLKKDQTTTVEGGKTLTFTAVPKSADFMVAGWFINGKEVEGELSNTLVIEELDRKIHVTVQYAKYKGYALPTANEGYLLSEMKRTPDDTEPKTDIRENGTLSFVVTPDTENKYVRIDKMIINGYDCLSGKLLEEKEQPDDCTSVKVEKNKNGSYAITISGITGEIQTDITAHKHTLKKVDKVNPTCTKAGNKEYWICEDENCKEMFLEEAAMKAVQWKDILLPATGHNYQNGICGNCGANDPTYVDIHPGTPKVKAKAKGVQKIKLSWSQAKDAQGYIVYRYNAKTKKYAVIANTKKTAYTDKKRTPGTVYRYLVKAYGVSLNKKVIYGQVSNCAVAVTKPQTPKITSVKKAGTTKAMIQLKTKRNVKGYQLYEYMWQTKKFKLVGKIEGKKYYKYDSKKKKFIRDRKSKVVQNAKKKTISVKITTNNLNFKRYRRYRFKVRSYVKYNGKQIFSKISKQKIVTR
ncbi:fibronectin type III domain-containing protein [Anaerobutyricum soehngenii]|uniref:Fibronectin type III domain-containing protein n=1 Tax=Anaerobutyricum soehngenii TaxID=105843 RepID=A0ABS3ZHG7_9FIRM|nr:fibronectin type III domain-containing protein [Anaerobutyricum soehngenii]MBP0056063.1 fibronectin type III domain-containing protein [Anaerobutyricum soehngenii]